VIGGSNHQPRFPTGSHLTFAMSSVKDLVEAFTSHSCGYDIDAGGAAARENAK